MSYKIPKPASNGATTVSAVLNHLRDYSIVVSSKKGKSMSIPIHDIDKYPWWLAIPNVNRTGINKHTHKHYLATMLDPHYYYAADGTWYISRMIQQKERIATAVSFVKNRKKPQCNGSNVITRFVILATKQSPQRKVLGNSMIA